MSTLILPRLKILAAAFLFSTGGMAVKSCTLTAWQVASFRCAVGAVAILVMLPAARRRWTGGTLAVGAAYAGTLTCFVLANKMTTAASAIFLAAAAPLYVLLLAPRLLGERTRARDVAVMAGMAVGLALLFADRPEPVATAPAPLAGNLFGVGIGVFWAFTVMGLRWLGGSGPRQGAPAAVVAGSVIAALMALPGALPVTSSQPSDWLWIGYLGVFQIALAYALLTTAVSAVPALEASLLLLVEPLFNPLWAYWSHGETPGPWAIGGGVLILGVTVAKSVRDAYSPPEPPRAAP
ncbi:MAG TPA: EamA family transporter [Thermoanaerobaculia bacterium]